MTTLQLYRNGAPHILIPIDEGTKFSQQVMGEHIITSIFISDMPLDIDEGDYIEFRGERYTLNKPMPPLDKSNSFTYSYSLVFEGYVYDLIDKVFRHEGALEFSYYGTPAALLALVVENMNSISEGWFVGTVDVLPEQLVEFYANGVGYNCKSALNKIAEEFKLEFWLRGKTINLTKESGVLTNLHFEYGRGKGLYRVTRGEIQDQNFFNRIYGQGSTKNIPFGYRNGAKRLSIEGGYLEYAILAGKRRKEASIIFEDIYPHRTGTLTSVSSDFLQLTDTSLDFDLSGLKVDGDTPRVAFQSGENSGKEFTIADYNHTTRTITIEPITEQDGYVMPNATFTIAVGDKYTLLGISMPAPYVVTAEAELRTAMADLLQKSQNAKPPYAVEIDEKYMRDNGITINAGDRARLKDTPMGIDSVIRVTSVKFPLVNVNQVDIVLSDTITYTNEEKAIIDNRDVKQEVVVVDRRNAEKARNNTMNMQKLKSRIFNPDGSLFTGPDSIVAGIAEFGYDSQNFGLVGVTIATNIANDANTLSISPGQLIHFAYKVDGLGYTWNMSGHSWSALDPDKFYYVYAKCSKTALIGTWEISEAPVFVNDLAGFYAFNLGQLYEVNADGYRDFDFTKGKTYFVGDTITSGRLQDITKQNYFDVITGEFNLENALSSLHFGPEGITLGGKIIATSAEFIDLMVKNIVTGPVNTKRVAITAAQNNIEILDSLNQVLIQIDDDSAFEGGPGIRAGILGGVYSTLGNQGFYSINTSTNKRAFVRPDGIFTDGNLDVGLGAEINGKLEFFGELWSAGLKGLSFQADIRESVDTYRYIFNNGIVTQRTKLT